MKKLLWVRADGERPWNERKKLVTSALEFGADAVLVGEGEEARVRELGRIIVVSSGGEADIVLFNDLAAAECSSAKRAFFREIKNKADEEALSSAGGKVDFLILRASDWKVIPLENIIAGVHGRSKIIVEVSGKDEAALALRTLEVGADGVLVGGSPAEIKEVRDVMEEALSEKLTLSVAEVTKVVPVGMGDRVCIDACSMFAVGEGMLVGSQSSGLFLVHSESIETPYVAPRPFRVNAGPVHAYTRMPDGKTRYLSELSAGDEVLAVDHLGNTQRMIIGRAKIEKRPLILIEAESGGTKLSTILQNAETIRLVTPDGKPLSVAVLKPKDKVLVHIETGGRHFGMKIKETIKEK
jgi:3-dehydroquinate synthase II